MHRQTLRQTSMILENGMKTICALTSASVLVLLRVFQPWVEHSKALLCVSLNKQEGIWCLLLLLANTALTVTATIITAISVVAINNTTVLAIEVRTVATLAKIKHPSRAGETIRERERPQVCLHVGQSVCTYNLGL